MIYLETEKDGAHLVRVSSTHVKAIAIGPTLEQAKQELRKSLNTLAWKVQDLRMSERHVAYETSLVQISHHPLGGVDRNTLLELFELARSAAASIPVD